MCRSLDTADRATVKRKLADLHHEVDRTAGGMDRVTLADLYDRYMATGQNQSAKRRKEATR